MQTILTKLEKTRAQLVKKAEHRDAYYMKRTEDWQESEKGIEYDVNTGLIADVVENLDNAIEDVKLILK